MGLVDTINLFFTLLLDTLRQLGRWRIWLLLGLYFALLVTVLYAHYAFLLPIFYPVVKAWVQLVASPLGLNPEPFFHYPGHFYFLGQYFGWAKLLIGIFVEGIILGTLAMLFVDVFSENGDSRLSDAFRRARPLWLQLAIAWIVLNALTTVLGLVIPDLIQNKLYSPKRVFIFSALLMPGFLTLVIAPFFYSIAAVAVKRVNALSAIGLSFRLFFRKPFTTLVFTVLVVSGPMIISIINTYSDRVVSTFRPELMYWIILGGLVIEMVANFLWIGIAARYLTFVDAD